jgi:DNA-binding IclR family transcriptional regulator
MLLTIGCAGRVLELFTDEVPDRGVTEVAGILQISKSKAHALLASLAEVGLLRSVEGGRYRLGWRLLSLSRVLNETTDFRVHARPVMDTLAAHLGELVLLATISGDQVLYVDRATGRAAAGIPASVIGATLPAHATGVGKALLARQSPEALDRLLCGGPLPALTPDTITDPRVLRAELEEIRRRGFAIDHGESVAGISCAAAPIVACGPHAVAAISIAVPSERFACREAVYRTATVRAAAHISRALRRDGSAPSRRIPDTRMPLEGAAAQPRAFSQSADRELLEVA